MIKDILYLIVIHNPAIIDYFESMGKYLVLENYKYVLVGKHEKDYTNDKIIQCDRLSNNIEEDKNFLAYTGWWGIGKNCLSDIKEKHIFFLEYDSDIINPEKLKEMEEYISNYVQISGIAELPLDVCFFTSIHGVRLKQFLIAKYKGTEIGAKDMRADWMVSNNIVFRKDLFDNFINGEELKELLDYLKGDVMAGHDLERYTTCYAALRDIRYGCVYPVCFQHMALDSHNTQGRVGEYEKFRDISKISN